MFWAVVNRLLIIFQVIVLLLSEIGWPTAFFNHYFPVLGTSFGLGPIGIFQCLLGAAILSHHVDDFTLVAAFFLFAIGCLNMMLGLIFRDTARSRRSITEWRTEAKGVLPSSKDLRPTFARPASSFVPSLFKTNNDSSSREKTGFGFGAQGEKTAGLKGTRTMFSIDLNCSNLPLTLSRVPYLTTARDSSPLRPSPSSFWYVPLQYSWASFQIKWNDYLSFGRLSVLGVVILVHWWIISVHRLPKDYGSHYFHLNSYHWFDRISCIFTSMCSLILHPRYM